LVFTFLFTLELLLRLYVIGLGYLKSAANIMDAIIVIISIFDLCRSLFPGILADDGGNAGGGVRALRLMRLAKLSKVLRIVRVLKVFEPLRVLVATIVASIGALMWSMILLFVLELVGAIFTTIIFQPEIQEQLNKQDSDECLSFSYECLKSNHLWQNFGTWSRSMVTMFNLTMAPGGFLTFTDMSTSRFLTLHGSQLFVTFVLIYVCFVTFAIVRVITAMFLKATLEATTKDEKRLAETKAKEREEKTKELKSIVDKDRSGEIDRAEYNEMLQLPYMEEWISELQLKKSDTALLFKILDSEQKGQVKFERIVEAFNELSKGELTHAQRVMWRMECRSTHDQMTRMEGMQRQRSNSEKILMNIYGSPPTSPIPLEDIVYC
jgi:membrane protein implicated in regulation of membrane protease activity